MRDTTFIYSLSCPLDGEIKYIGKSNDPKSRFRKHKSLGDTNKGDNPMKNIWIKNLLEKGFTPILSIIEEVDIKDWKVREKFYIKYYKELGYKLYNVCGGGNGPTFGNSGSYVGNPPVKVVCLKKSGEFVKEFNSLKEGKEFCGKSIYNVLVGKRKTSGGYIWIYKDKYDNLSDDDLKSIIENANINNNLNNGISTRFVKGNISNKRKKVNQYTIDGIFIKSWEHVELAANEYGCSKSNIRKCALGLSKTSVNYIWKYDI
jgi:hypothetical protein